jgi:hypothetical protein
MDDTRFDDLAQSLTFDSSRRGALRLLAGSALGGVLAHLGLEAAAACLAAGKTCSSGDACCSGFCGSRGSCCLVKGKRCKRGAQCCSGLCNRRGRCACLTDGKGCRAAATINCCSGRCEGGQCAPCPSGQNGCGGTCGRCCGGADCDDGIACTDDSCVDGSCRSDAVHERCQPPAGECLTGICDILDGGCQFSSHCSLGEICESGVCVCAPTSVDCGTHCCPEGWECFQSGCRGCSSGRPICNGNCCGGNETCLGGTCCPNTRVCGTGCCPEGQSCAGDACCPDARACGAVCCPAGQICQVANEGRCESGDL